MQLFPYPVGDRSPRAIQRELEESVTLADGVATVSKLCRGAELRASSDTATLPTLNSSPFFLRGRDERGEALLVHCCNSYITGAPSVELRLHYAFFCAILRDCEIALS